MFNLLFDLFSTKKTPAELVKIRNVGKIESSSIDIMSGVVRQYKQMHDKKVANEVLQESLRSLKKVKSMN